MKHLLNNLSEEEKNSIREQHEGGMLIDTSKFKSLVENKSGNVKPLVEDLEMMDVSSDSEYYQNRKREVSIPGDDLSVAISLAKSWCESQGYRVGGSLDDISLDECKTVAMLNRKYSYL